ncbi:unnamed protein product, partial [Urochloa humidicola]
MDLLVCYVLGNLGGDQALNEKTIKCMCAYFQFYLVQSFISSSSHWRHQSYEKRMVRSLQTARISSIPQYNIHVYHPGPVDVPAPPPPVIELDNEDEEDVDAPVDAVEEPQVDPVEVPPLAAGVEAQAEVDAGSDHPVQPLSPPPERWTVRTHCHDGGGARFPRLLEQLFEQLEYTMKIEYVGHKREHPRYPEGWDVFVHIGQPDYEVGGTVDEFVYRAISTRASFAAGIDDAARQALSRLLYAESHLLEGGAWSHFPQRPPNQVFSLIEGIRDQVSAELKLQADYTTAQYSYADGTTDELRNTVDLLAAERLENKRLRAALHGKDPTLVRADEERWPAHS